MTCQFCVKGEEKKKKKKDSVTHHVLLGNEALNEAIRVGLLEDIRESGVLRVTIQGHHTRAGIPHPLQGDAISLPSGDLSGQTKAEAL